ncbi:hypothetical protein [Streptomyces noursei]
MLDLIVPGAGPDLQPGTTPRNDEESASAYITRTGTLPPHWADDTRLRWQCHRDDAVLLLARQETPRIVRERLRRWLTNYGLDDLGRPKTLTP